MKKELKIPGLYYKIIWIEELNDLRRNIFMISAGDFRNGVTLEIEGNVMQILEFQHVKPGKGAAFVRTKLKNVISGGVVEKTFRQSGRASGRERVLLLV